MRKGEGREVEKMRICENELRAMCAMCTICAMCLGIKSNQFYKPGKGLNWPMNYKLVFHKKCHVIRGEVLKLGGSTHL